MAKEKSAGIPGEKWKELEIPFPEADGKKVRISNHGRVKSYSKSADGQLIEGTLQGGYRVLKFKIQKPKPKETIKLLNAEKSKVEKAEASVSAILENIATEKNARNREKLKKSLAEAKKELGKIKRDYKKMVHKDNLSRTINYSILLHRAVADLFLKKKSAQHNIVIHQDFNKLNNAADNLSWVTQQECSQHHMSNPVVIAEKKRRIGRAPTNTKLTAEKVLEIKKKVAEGSHSNASIATKFGISSTQLKRIITGENWSSVKLGKTDTASKAPKKDKKKKKK
jgi:ATP:corrinoid adenosyltransferase